MCCNNECLETIMPACVAPIEGLPGIVGNNLQEQILTMANMLNTELQQQVTVSFGSISCDEYKYEYTLTDLIPTNPGGNFTIGIDLFAFNDYVPNTLNLIITNSATTEILYTGANTTITLAKPSLLQGINISVQFITNTGQIRSYTDTIVLNNFSVLNHSYIRYLNCNTSGVVTSSVQAILQTIINQLQNCC
jgi:hypothetical protein